MKRHLLKILFAISFIINSGDLSAQAYVPFPESDVIWNEKAVGYNGQNFYTIYYNFYSDNDTVINSKTYTKLFKDEQGLYNQYKGAYRNDSAARRVYFVPDTAVVGNELLLYDFNLADGDTVRWHHYFNYLQHMSDSAEYYIVDSVYTMQINGVARNCYALKAYYQFMDGIDQTWIEGVGSTTGFFPQFAGFEHFTNLMCYYLNGNMVQSFTGGPCVLVTGFENNLQPEINFYYSQGALHFTGAEVAGSKLAVYDVSGREVYSCVLQSGSTAPANLSSGVYCFIVQTGTAVYSGKFVAR